MSKGLIVVCLFLSACNYRIEKNPPAETEVGAVSEAALDSISFQEVYNKVFQPHCVTCHGSSGSVNLETYDSARSALAKIQVSALEKRTMPKAPYSRLSDDEVLTLAAWVQAGGPELPRNGSQPPAPPVIEPLTPHFLSIQKRIFIPKCMGCHAPGKSVARIPFSTKEDLINSEYDVVIPGHPEESGLTLHIQPGARKFMPPKKSGITPLNQEEISVITEWIQNGAKD